MEKSKKKIKMVYVDLERILTLNGSQLENYNFVTMLANEKFAKKVERILNEMKLQFETGQNKRSLTDTISSILLKGDITKSHIATLLNFVSKDYYRVSNSVRNFLISNSIEGIWY